MGDKNWQMPFGERGHSSEADPATEQIRWAHINQQRIRQKREDELEELKHKVEKRDLEKQLGNKGGNVEETEKKIEDAAEMAAEATAAGVPPEDSKNLGAGKTRLAIIKPGGEQPSGEKGGWSVLNGRPIRDPEGEYTFSQALKVAQLELPRTPSNDNKKSLGEELADAKMKLEALGIKVGNPAPAPNRSLKEEVAESVELLQALGIHVGTSQQAPLKEQVTEAKSLLEGLGLSIGLPGESIESMREKFHHEEKMDELRSNREHQDRLADIASEIPERIGSGIGEDMRRTRGSKGQKASSGSNLPSFTCEECHKDFPIPPEAEAKGEMTCPYCGMVYRTKGKEASGEGT